MRTQPTVLEQGRDLTSQSRVQGESGSTAAWVAGIQFMINELMRGSGTDKRGTYYEVTRELALNRKVIRLNIAAMQQSWERAAADHGGSRNRSDAGRQIRHGHRRNASGNRSVGSEAVG